MKQKIFLLACSFFLVFGVSFLGSLEGVFAADDNDAQVAADNAKNGSVPSAASDNPAGATAPSADYTTANLEKVGLLTFGGPKNIPQLGVMIMSFLGETIIFASVLGFMIGGGFLVFSAGDEGMMSRGKDIMIASVVGLVVTLLAYLLVTLVQSFLYAL